MKSASRAELSDTASSAFAYASGDMLTARLFATATRLRGGQVLITGGYHGNVDVTSDAWIYRV